MERRFFIKEISAKAKFSSVLFTTKNANLAPSKSSLKK